MNEAGHLSIGGGDLLRAVFLKMCSPEVRAVK